MIISYEQRAYEELELWKKEMRKKPSILDRVSKGAQNKFNNILPEKYHQIVTEAIKNMVKVVIFGSKVTTKQPYENISLEEREMLLDECTKIYKTTAIVEGVSTGMGGFLLGLADLPLLLSIKIKYLYDVAAIYGYDVRDYRERVYILNIMQLAFSSKRKRRNVFSKVENFESYYNLLPEDINSFDWRSFQQEYRDYLDLAKLLQLIPGIGAVVGAYINSKLINKLSETAKQSYRMRYKSFL